MRAARRRSRAPGRTAHDGEGDDGTPRSASGSSPIARAIPVTARLNVTYPEREPAHRDRSANHVRAEKTGLSPRAGTPRRHAAQLLSLLDCPPTSLVTKPTVRTSDRCIHPAHPPVGRGLTPSNRRGLTWCLFAEDSSIVLAMAPTSAPTAVHHRPPPVPGTSPNNRLGPGRPMGHVGQFVVRHRRAVLVFWFLVALAGVALVGNVTSRLSTTGTLPGSPSYAASQQILRIYGTGGDNSPVVMVLHLPWGQRARRRRAAPTSPPRWPRSAATRRCASSPTRIPATAAS